MTTAQMQDKSIGVLPAKESTPMLLISFVISEPTADVADLLGGLLHRTP